MLEAIVAGGSSVAAYGELRKFVAPEFLFGVGAIDRAGQYVVNLGARKPLLVSDGGVAAAGWPRRVVASLEALGVEHAEFTAVMPNPRTGEVASGAECYRREGCDGIVAVGGGSPMDCAKGIGVEVSTDKPIAEFEGVDKVWAPMPPMICVPTTAGTAADVSQFAILTRLDERRKIAVISKAVVPDLSLIDPLCLTTMPDYLTACTGIDALVHAIEAFVSSGNSPITDLHALQAVRLVSGHLQACLAQGDNLEDRSGMALASLEAGLAFSNASLGAVHAMAHALGGLLDLPHGECNALLLEHVVDFNFEAAPERYRRIAQALGVQVGSLTDGEARRALCAALHELRSSVGITRSLASAGVRGGDIGQLAQNAMRDACLVTNPRIPCQRDLEVIYEQAL